MDAALVGTRLNGIGTLPDFERYVHAAHASGETVFFSAESVDYLYQLYLWFFERFHRGEASGRQRFLLLDRQLLAELQATVRVCTSEYECISTRPIVIRAPL